MSWRSSRPGPPEPAAETRTGGGWLGLGWVGLLALLAARTLAAETFQLPTANRALFEPGGEERFFVGTVGKPWETGTFGCVRSEGWQIHEGLDIRCLQRNRRGEPLDPVMATAATLTVVEVSRVVETGGIDPETVVTPGIFVDRILDLSSIPAARTEAAS